jgi:C4-dicarboxylate-binding protein DctP
MKRGVIDGAENTLSNFYTQRMHEVQKHLTISNHGYIGYAVIANRRFWDSLPSDVRTVLEGVIRDTTAYERDLASEQDIAILERLKAAGGTQIYELTAEERKSWQRTLQPLQEIFRNAIGADLIQAVHK